MATVNLSILGGQAVTPTADVLTLDGGDQAGQSFIVIRLGEDASVIGPGVGREQVVYARELAAALTIAADTIERTLAESVPCV